jgi:choline dehydrogenase-like flavoprotein
MAFGENDMAMAAHAHARLCEIANMGGYTIETNPSALSPGSAAHELGTARMGTDQSSSVLDPCNRVWGLPNVLVTDAAAFPSGGYQFPVINIMAISGRAAAELARSFSRRDL